MKDEVKPVFKYFFIFFFSRERSKLKSAHDLECRYGLHSHRLNGTPPFLCHYLSLESPEINKTCAVVAIMRHCEIQSILLLWQKPYIFIWVRWKRKEQQQFDVTAGCWGVGQTVETAPGVKRVGLPLKPRMDLSIWTKNSVSVLIFSLFLAHIINMTNCTVQLNYW